MSARGEADARLLSLRLEREVLSGAIERVYESYAHVDFHKS